MLLSQPGRFKFSWGGIVVAPDQVVPSALELFETESSRTDGSPPWGKRTQRVTWSTLWSPGTCRITHTPTNSERTTLQREGATPLGPRKRFDQTLHLPRRDVKREGRAFPALQFGTANAPFGEPELEAAHATNHIGQTRPRNDANKDNNMPCKFKNILKILER